MEAKQVLWITSPSSLRATRPISRPGWSMDRRTPDAALVELRRRSYEAVVLDFPIPDWTPAELVEQVKALAGLTPKLIRDPGASLSDAVKLARMGVYQFFVSDEEAILLIEAAMEERKTESLVRLAANVDRQGWESLLVGESHEMRQVSHIIRMVGGRRATVLITGETGTGKEIAARALHLAGSRRRNPMVAVNCSALPENLLEAELFGHVRGAFTGAIQNRIGRFEQAQGGTLFLDEIGELPMELQAKLLRVLQEREYQRLGSSETIRADVRVVAATNCDLLERIGRGEFREDLYYRLNVVPIQMPPLRNRREDIPLLAEHFVAKICRLEDIPAKSLSRGAMARLCDWDWPGNVRQLENAVEMAVALSGDRSILDADDFPLTPASRVQAVRHGAFPVVSVPDEGLDFDRTVAQIERSILEQALRKTGGNKKAAAEMLRLKRTTLAAKMRSLEWALPGVMQQADASVPVSP